MGIRSAVARLRRRGWSRLVVLLGLAGFVVGVYLVVVLGGGMLLGRTESPGLALSVVATAAVALLFAPVQAALERAAATLPGGADITPYDVLRHFSDSLTDGDPTEDLPARMSRMLAQGTRAEWAQVWLTGGDRLTLAATWPVGADADRGPPVPQPQARDATGEGRRALLVSHGGETLGMLRLQERPGLSLTAVEERLFAGLAAQAGLVLQLVGLRADLDARHDELVARAAELKASRGRLIETQDTERRRLERDIHDGAQQHLVALGVNLRLAQTVATRSPERAARLLAEQADAADDAIEMLTSLAHGMSPQLLAAEGLGPALRSAVLASAIPVSVESDGVGRIPAAVETALYFFCMEAVQNAGKHSGATVVTVRLREERTHWRLDVSDEGAGFDEAQVRAGAGTGLASMCDRLESVGGTVTLRSLPGRGTTVTGVVPRDRAVPSDGAADRAGSHLPLPRRTD